MSSVPPKSMRQGADVSIRRSASGLPTWPNAGPESAMCPFSFAMNGFPYRPKDAQALRGSADVIGNEGFQKVQALGNRRRGEAHAGGVFQIAPVDPGQLFQGALGQVHPIAGHAAAGGAGDAAFGRVGDHRGMPNLIQAGFTGMTMVEVGTKAGNAHKPHLKKDAEHFHGRLPAIELAEYVGDQLVQRFMGLSLGHPQIDDFGPIAGVDGLDDVFTDVEKRLFQGGLLENRHSLAATLGEHHIQSGEGFQHAGKAPNALFGRLGDGAGFALDQGEQGDDEIEIAEIDPPQQDGRGAQTGHGSDIQKTGGDGKIKIHTDDIDGGGHKGTRGHGRIDIDAGQQHGNGRSHQGGHGHGAHHRQADGQGQQDGVVLDLGHRADQGAVDHAQDEAHGQLLAHHRPDIANVQATRGQAAHHDGRGLRADVSAHAHDNGDESGQIGDAAQAVLKPADHVKGEDAAQAAGKQPRQADARAFDDALGLDELLADTGHLENILGGFLAEDVDDVIHGDDAHDAVVVVHHRHRQNIVAGHQLGDFFLIHVGLHGDHIGGHEGLEWGLRFDHDQLSQGTHPHQLAIGVDHVQIERHLHIGEFLLDPFDGLGGGDFLIQGDEIGVHDPTGAVIGKAHEILDLIGTRLVHALEQAVDRLLGQMAEQIGHVIVGHGLEDRHHLFRIHVFDEVDEEIFVEFAEQDAFLFHILDHVEEQPLIRVRKIPEEDGKVCAVGFVDNLAQTTGGTPAQEALDSEGQNGLAVMLHQGIFRLTI
ncbi:hypothetical protein DESC_100092 [Desulfosarcina cetonica]|nr:hypothetical protein DESC_100092 [Desulfosarcina cetonica]